MQREQSGDPLSIPADRRVVDALARAGRLSPDARRYALTLLYPADRWESWISRILLLCGVTLLLAGIVYFFAYNWNAIPPLVKLGSLEFALFISLLFSSIRGVNRTLAGRTALLCASVLVGVFLAVFGQIYQTGADSYLLFFGWSGLIVIWTVLGNFAPLWLLWLAVTDIGLILYWGQVYSRPFEGEFEIYPILILFNGPFLILREYLAARGTAWLRPAWTRDVLLIPLLICAVVPGVIFMVDPADAHAEVAGGAALAAVLHGGAYVYYRREGHAFRALAAVLLSSSVIAVAGAVGLGDAFGFRDTGVFFAAGAGAIIFFSAATVHLLRLRTRETADV